MQSAKDKITRAVEKYTIANPEEFGLFKAAMDKARDSLADEEFGVAQASQNRMRALFEMPVTLDEMIHAALTPEERLWFKDGGKDRKEGAHWFANTFPVFRLPHSV